MESRRRTRRRTYEYKLKYDEIFTLNKYLARKYYIVGPFGKIYIKSKKLEQKIDRLNNGIVELRTILDDRSNEIGSSLISSNQGTHRLSHTFIFSKNKNKEDDVGVIGNFLILEIPVNKSKNVYEPKITLSLLTKDTKSFSLEEPTKIPYYYLEIDNKNDMIKIYIKSPKIIKLLNSKTLLNSNGLYNMDDLGIHVELKNDTFLLNYNFEFIQNISSTQQLSDTLKFNGPFLIHQQI